MNKVNPRFVWLGVLAGLWVGALAVEWAPDLAGPYCASRAMRPAHGGCCVGRQDECSVPILSTLCYCDTFCNRTLNPDCCPDYFSHCFGQPYPTDAPLAPSPIIRRDCFFNGREYPLNAEIQNNCNRCKCTSMSETRSEMLCSSDKCLIEPQLIDAINSRFSGWTARNYSEFWGRTLQDGRTYRLGTLHPSKAVMNMTPLRRRSVEKLPRSFDARSEWPGMVSPVQDQGWCGASWALSTAAVASDRYAIMSKGEEMPRLSTQHLLDCNNNRNQHGCNGGHLDRAWFFLRKFGLVPENCYPWTGKAEKCRVPKRSNLEAARCPSLRPAKSPKKQTELYRMGPAYRLEREEDIMHEIMISGPVQATMQVYQDLFSYSGGVYKNLPITGEDRTGFHSVRVLGWGEESNPGSLPTKYWVVANSWGEWWGENGLFRIQRGTNECHIEDFVLAAWAHTHVESNALPQKRSLRQHSSPRAADHRGKPQT